MSVGTICSHETHMADPDETARTAANRMKDENVGTLLVVDANREPVGILTDRDLALRVVAAGLDPGRATVGEVMTAYPRSVIEDTPIEDAVALMRGLAVRRLPVVDEHRRLVGIVTLDDVLELVTEEMGSLSRIVASSRPGVSVPATRRSRRALAGAAGLQRASADIEC